MSERNLCAPLIGGHALAGFERSILENRIDSFGVSCGIALNAPFAGAGRVLIELAERDKKQ